MNRFIIDHLISWKNQRDRKPLIVRGARQTGKTFALKKFGKTHFRETHYFNFEKQGDLAGIFEKNLEPKRILSDLGIATGKSIDIENDLVIFDEITFCPKALTSLKYFNEDLPAAAVCSAGSLLGIMLGESSFPVGKVNFLELKPMCFCEFLIALGEERFLEAIKLPVPEFIHSKLWGLLKDYFIVGGLPAAVDVFRKNMDNRVHAFELVRQTQDDLITAYMADIAKNSGKTNSMHIARVFKNIPEQLAKNLDGRAGRFRFKGVIPGHNRYGHLAGPIDWLLNAGLVYAVYEINHAQIPLAAYKKDNAFKLYLFDVGILGALGSIDPASILKYDYGTYKGYFAENYVLQEMKTKRPGEYYYWKENTAEVEFLLGAGGQLVPLEVKSGLHTRSKSLNSFIKRYKPDQALVLSADNSKSRTGPVLERKPLYFAGLI